MLQILETSHSKIGQKLRMLLHLLCRSIVSSTILLRRVLLLLEDQVPHSLLLSILLQVLQVKMSVKSFSLLFEAVFRPVSFILSMLTEVWFEILYWFEKTILCLLMYITCKVF